MPADQVPTVIASKAATLPRDPDGPSTAGLEHVFDEPVEVAAVTVGLPGPRGFGAAPPAHAVLEASDDGVTWRTVTDLPELVNPAATSIPVRSASFAPVRARRFRLTLSGAAAEAALPPLADGVTTPPVLRKAAEFPVSEFTLWTGGRVHRAELKAGFAAAPDYYALDTDPTAVTVAIDPARVVDLTGQVDAGGVCDGTPPPAAGSCCGSGRR